VIPPQPNDSPNDSLVPTTKKAQEEPSKNLPGPGRYLSEARQAQNLTIDDVASRLCLDAATICHLEEEEYDKLPEPVFVRGYLHSYARFLGIGPESILGRITPHQPTQPRPVQYITHRSQMRGSHFFVRGATYLIIFCLAALVFSWWQNQTINVPPDHEMGNEGSVVLQDQEEPPDRTRISPDNNPGSSSEPLVVTENAVTGMHTNRKLSGEFSQSSDMASGSAPLSAGEGSVEGGGQAVSSEHLVTEGSRQPQPSDTLEPKRLILHLKADSWVELYDRHGKKLCYQVALAGRTYEFQGLPPFQITLGYARGVDIVYDNKPFDFASYIQGEFAEFLVGEE